LLKITLEGSLIRSNPNQIILIGVSLVKDTSKVDSSKTKQMLRVSISFFISTDLLNVHNA